MYSTRIQELGDEPVEFGTSGLLYRSNKLMYDRKTFTLWRQFVGEPVVGELAGSGIKLKVLPMVLTTLSEWLAMHPDTTVLSPETGFYPPELYVPESDSQSIYYSYRNNPGTTFPVWPRSDALANKEIVLGVVLGGVPKAYPQAALKETPVLNDALADTGLVVITDPEAGGARAYLRSGVQFEPGSRTVTRGEATVTDTDGNVWRVTEEALVRADDPSSTLARIPTHMAYWFGWYSSYSNTLVHGQGAP